MVLALGKLSLSEDCQTLPLHLVGALTLELQSCRCFLQSDLNNLPFLEGLTAERLEKSLLLLSFPYKIPLLMPLPESSGIPASSCQRLRSWTQVFG